jgi:hypothetical protein
MCKPSCCRGSNNSGLGAVVAIIIGLAVVTAAAGPVIRFMEKLLMIAAITFGCLAGMAVLIGVVALIIRYRRTMAALINPQSRMQQLPADHQTRLSASGQSSAYRVLQSPKRKHLVMIRTEDDAHVINKNFLP